MNSLPQEQTDPDILIVDDTPINLRVLAKILSDRGYKVRKALNGNIALTACQTLLPNVILLDIMMPEMDGYEVCERLKSDPKTQDIPVIFISALEDEWDKVKAFKSGGSDYINKPFQIEEVVARVQHHLMLQHLRSQVRLQSAQLQALNAQILQSNRELEQFAQVASHDLHSPLQVIRSNAELLFGNYQTLLGPEGAGYLTQIFQSSGQMNHLIHDLLTYFKVDIPPPSLAEIDANLVLEEVLTTLSGEIIQSGAMITHSHLPNVQANELQLRQVFQQLLTNGLKFRHPEVPPQIQISGHRNDSREWQFEIQDNGIGIDPDSGDRIFAAFYRLHSSAQYPGTGMGLTLCKKIVERHGGKLWFQSHQGAGTSFYFTLPALES